MDIANAALGHPAIVMVGREPEFEKIESLAKRSANGRGCILLIEGEPGIGKTLLLSQAKLLCSRLGFVVMPGACYELETRLAFSAIYSSLSSVSPAPGTAQWRSADLVGSEADLAGARIVASGPLQEHLIIEGILEHVERLCASGPVAIAIDDLQWADPSSLIVIGRLARICEQLPLFLVGATRPVSGHQELGKLVRGLETKGIVRIWLAALSEPSTAEFARLLVGGAIGTQLRKQIAAAGGNPFFIEELIVALARGGYYHVTDGTAELCDPAKPGMDAYTVPASVAGAIKRRIGFLTDGARTALPMLAVLEHGITISELAAILRLPITHIRQVLDEAVLEGILAETGDCLNFRHELVRQALAAQLSVSERQGIHHFASESLIQMGAPVERVAEHLLASANLNATTLDWLVLSADALVLKSPNLAIDLIDLGLISAQRLRYPDVKHLLESKRARALLCSGRPAESRLVALAALKSDPNSGRTAHLYWLIVQSYIHEGSFNDGQLWCRTAIDSGRLDGAESARFHGLRAQCLHFAGNSLQSAEGEAKQAITEGEKAKDNYAIAYGLWQLASALNLEWRSVEALELFDRVIALWEAPDTVLDHSLPIRLGRGYALEYMDRFDEADQEFAIGLKECEIHGREWLAWHYQARARLRFFDGRWDEALAEIQAGSDSVDYLSLMPSLGSLAALIAVHRGTTVDVTKAREVYEHGAGFFFEYLRRWAWALSLEAEGDPRQALEILTEGWRSGVGTRVQAMPYHFCLDIVRLARSLDEHALIREVWTVLSTFANYDSLPSTKAVLLYCHGMTENDVARLVDAAALFRVLCRPLYEGYAHEEVAVALATTGDERGAREALEFAVECYKSCQAVWDCRRVEARLRIFGIRRGRRDQHRRNHSGWEALTGTELDVAKLVSAGYSNPEIGTRLFMSRKTAQAHVSSILRKLGMTSRVEVAVAVARKAS